MNHLKEEDTIKVFPVPALNYVMFELPEGIAEVRNVRKISCLDFVKEFAERQGGKNGAWLGHVTF